MGGNGVEKLFGAGMILALALGLALIPYEGASKVPQEARPPQSAVADPVPAFHAHSPTGELPATIDPGEFTDPVVQNAYAVAAKVKKILYQQPCYCHCDRSQGHKSLLDCFASKHGSGCGTCIYEDFYAFEQSRKGKSASQIREGIIRGDWKTVDATKYRQPLPEK